MCFAVGYSDTASGACSAVEVTLSQGSYQNSAAPSKDAFNNPSLLHSPIGTPSFCSFGMSSERCDYEYLHQNERGIWGVHHCGTTRPWNEISRSSSLISSMLDLTPFGWPADFDTVCNSFFNTCVWYPLRALCASSYMSWEVMGWSVKLESGL